MRSNARPPNHLRMSIIIPANLPRNRGAPELEGALAHSDSDLAQNESEPRVEGSRMHCRSWRAAAVRSRLDKSSRGATRPGRRRMRRLTLRGPVPNHRLLDGSSLSWRHGGIIGNVTDGPKSGILIAADPATVERSGFAIGFGAGLSAGCMGSRGRSGIKPEKPLAWHRDQPGWTPLLLRIVRLSRSRPQRPRVGDDVQKVRCRKKRREGEAGRSGPDIATSPLKGEAMFGPVTP